MEAIRGDETVAQLASRHQIHPNVIARWERMALENLIEVFRRGGPVDSSDPNMETRALQAKIGELVIERDLLARALGR